MYDVIIVGAGAAGLSAAIYTARRKLKTLVLSIDKGGQTILTSNIQNYPGFLQDHGASLMRTFEKQAVELGVEIILGRVNKVENINNNFKITLSNNEIYESKSVILAYGKVPAQLNVLGEDKFFGRGIHIYAIYDALLFKDKNVAVIGGGNSALDASLILSKYAKKVYLIHRRNEFRGEQVLQDKVKALNNVEIILENVPAEFKGKEKLNSLVIKNINDNKLREINVEGCFVEIGYINKVDFVKDLVDVNEKNEIVVDIYCNTKTKGLFAAGDVTIIPYKQTITSAGEGCKAALTCYNYLMGKTGPVIDWTH
ncbi:MAG: FAD-dependent oxidoreductase [Nanoarchaeota archaeon]